MRDSRSHLQLVEPEPTPPPRRPLLCRLGLHKIAARNQHVLREDGVWYDRTLNRCERDDCPQSLWWRCVDVERSHHQMSFEPEDPE